MRIFTIIFLLAVAMVSDQPSYADISSEDKAFVTSFIARIKDAGNDSQKLAALDKEFFAQQAKFSEYFSDDETHQQEEAPDFSGGLVCAFVLAGVFIAALIGYGLDAEARERAEYNRSLDQLRANAVWQSSMNNTYNNSYYGYGRWK